ncbi:MAG: DNA repair protein RecN [Candidatus Nanopelagicales bacterium]
MLEQLRIKKLGLIDSAELQFSSGLIVISGETGAGKTLLLDGLVALTGYKPASADMVEDDTFIEGVIDLSARKNDVEALGVELDDGLLYIARQFPKEGKSKASLQAKSAPSSLLRDLSEIWIAIHGQHDTYRLLNPKTHLGMLDDFGGETIVKLRTEVADAYRSHQTLSKHLKSLQAKRDEALRIAESLREDVALCENLAIEPDEDLTIVDTIRMIQDSESVHESLSAALQSLENDDVSISLAISRATSALEKVARSNPEVLTILDELKDAGNRIAESQSKILYLAEKITTYESDIDSLMQRQNHIKRLLQKYGPKTDDLFTWLEVAKEQLRLVDIGDEEISKVERDLRDKSAELQSWCESLHQQRISVAKELQLAITKELEDLALAAARFEIVIERTDTTENGFDSVEFMFSANPGMRLSPLQDSASGGELSRLMLALEVSLLKDSSIPVLIFDEIDTGVAGATALSIARKLVLVSQKSQVFVVSHLPQIAAFADQHFVVRKTMSTESTMTQVVEMNETERVSELARMLAGLEGSESAREHAEELLEKARAAKVSLAK